jgi:hypothetical protein
VISSPAAMSFDAMMLIWSVSGMGRVFELKCVRTLFRRTPQQDLAGRYKLTLDCRRG